MKCKECGIEMVSYAPDENDPVPKHDQAVDVLVEGVSYEGVCFSCAQAYEGTERTIRRRSDA